MSANSGTRERKVRSACRRCRERRIKCDGKTPSCSKCEKAGVPCIDIGTVEGQENVPRGFVTDALARLTWLEKVVKTRLPDVDLSAPSLATTTGEGASLPPTEHPQIISVGEVEEDATRNRFDPGTAGSAPPARRARTSAADEAEEDATCDHLDPDSTRPAKRQRLAAVDEAEAVETPTRFDHGLISFHLAVPRLHYLGASSGNLFVHLLPGGTSPRQQDQVLTWIDRHDLGSSKLIDDLRTLLPKRDECASLVRVFFSHNHPAYPVLHEPSFSRLIEALYASIDAPSTSSLQHNGWPDTVAAFSYNDELAHLDGKDVPPISITTAAALLFNVLSIASYVQAHRYRFAADPQRYGAKAFALTSSALAEISLPATQLTVLSVMQCFLSQHSGNSWVLLHLGMAYAVDLGLHCDAPDGSCFSRITYQMRRRTFFCLYRLDRFIGSMQGRPLGFQDDSFDLTFSTVLSDPIKGGDDIDQVYLSYSILRFQWAHLVSEIRHHLYRSSSSIPESTCSTLQADLLARLDAWLSDGLRQMDALRKPRPRCFKTELRVDYYYAVGLLYQPSPGCRRPGTAALRHCFESAANRLRLFWSLYEEGCLILSWPTAQCISLAGSTMAYCVWSSEQIRASLSITQLSADLRLCSSLLTLAGEWWPSARRGSRSFQRLANVTIESVTYRKKNASSDLPMPATHPPRANGPLQDAPRESQASVGEGLENIEDILSSFLQDDFQLPDMLGDFHSASQDPSNDFNYDSYGLY